MRLIPQLSLLLALAAPARAADAPWVNLLNGRDLAGWKIVALRDPAPVVVEDGAMVLRQRINTVEHTFVATEQRYRDFILELDLNDDPGFNSGILLRCADAPPDAAVRLNGYQVKIDNTPRAWTGGVFDDFGNGWRWLHDLADNEAGRAAFKLGEWAHFRIECLGSTIKVWVNGVPTCHLIDEKYKKGPIAFKIHSVGDRPEATRNVLRVKNIRIITDRPGRFAQPMTLPARPAPTTPGAYDKAPPVRPVAWTDTNYPDFITKVTDFGERSDWSHDGKKILFVERSFGDVYEFDLETKHYTPLTHHYYHGGYARALYLSNGDILLSGPQDFPGDDWRTARFKLSELWVLSRKLDKPPTRLGAMCWEGPAVSRTHPRIAWSHYDGDKYGMGGLYRIRVADIDYASGEPKLANVREVLNNDRAPLNGRVLEPQNFRPGREHELIVQVSGDCEVFGLNRNTGELVNYSNDPDSYDEPEGIYPDGQFTLVESSRHTGTNRGGSIDLWKLRLAPGVPEWERITWFNETGAYKASNPVVSDDGRFIAFQVAGTHEVAGIGHGIYVLDLEKRKKAMAAGAAQLPGT